MVYPEEKDPAGSIPHMDIAQHGCILSKARNRRSKKTFFWLKNNRKRWYCIYV